jgi:hypothetical protein
MHRNHLFFLSYIQQLVLPCIPVKKNWLTEEVKQSVDHRNRINDCAGLHVAVALT